MLISEFQNKLVYVCFPYKGGIEEKYLTKGCFLEEEWQLIVVKERAYIQ